ncbi:superoxide dismutase [Amphiplicatus metriothermophilus]|uniref:Superoxide dismutase n=1 Tax=Amphiplicatus metriothermophilus TaxID=1519374 RepID=A0A239PRH0_9PROT|nr:superoxide dismutase [Amphiplicatus metriothermophilus]MBB5518345.1 Fe-Mn family superoxide dismutase [Amphiplicatus metriothermophilus]SNT72486.1 superoxide dismutase, Fe-Mn family [Amphiplicatus metriothermophilus]
MAVTLPDLPYARDALAPHISEKTLDFHYGKHHQAYVDNLNKLISGSALDDASLEEIILETAGKSDSQGVFNNAAQVWNHTFYWRSMKPNGGGTPEGDIAKALEKDFGGYEGFREAFAKAGATQFGSGWAWLVVKDGRLEVRKTSNAELPLTEKGVTPLLTMDVWEHAYYLDYQNRRPAYIETFLDKLVNWEFAEENLKLV